MSSIISPTANNASTPGSALNDMHRGGSALGTSSDRGACCTFEWRQTRFQVVEVSGFAPIDALASFAIAGRLFAVCAHNTEPEAITTPHLPTIRGVLTPREVQVVELVASGLRNKQIAVRLQLSEFTIAAYVKQICRKLEVNNRTAMVSSCVQRFGVKPSVN